MNGLLEKYDGPLLLGEINPKDWVMCNTIYQRPTKETKWHDYAYLVLKNVKTGEKKLFTAMDPEMLIYVVNEDERDYNYCPAYRPLKECTPVRVKYKAVLDAIAQVGGEKCKQFLTSNRKAGARNLCKELFKYPYVLGADYDYTDYLRIEWALHYHNNDIHVHVDKMFMDIEVDGIDVPGFPKPGECPVNAVSLIDEASSTVFVFLLRNEKNPQIEEFERNMNTHIAEYHEAFDESYGELDYKIAFFDKEIDLIAAVFEVINTLKRDILGIWNMGFDIPFLIERIRVLGYDPASIICSPDFATKILNYRKDTKQHDFKRKNDVFLVTAYTVYIDQMGTYIKIRKQFAEQKSLKLNAIAQKELKDTKLDYSDEANIKTLPYENFPLFVMYNIKDTLLQLGIERKTHDMDTVFLNTLSNATPFHKIFSQTQVLKNHAYISYFTQGYIIGNNRNIDYTKDRFNDDEEEAAVKKKKEVEGALVGDPELNLHVGIEMYGMKSKYIFPYVIDFDYSSLYPSIIIAFNIGRETMIGKLVLDGFAHLNPDPTDILYDQGRHFIEALLSKDYSYIGKTYFNLPDIEECVKDLDEIYKI